MLTEFAPGTALPRDVAEGCMRRGGKQRGTRITFLCPAHDDHDPSADYDTVKMVWTCRQCHAGGGLIDLAEWLGIDPRDYQDEIIIVNGNGKHHEPLPPMTFEAWCIERRLNAGPLIEWYDIRETTVSGRPAVVFPTRKGKRVRFLDKQKPKARWLKSGSQTLYNIGSALELLGERVYLVNGEPSVWACQQSGVPAFCLCTGEEDPSADACAALRGVLGVRSVAVVYDRDEAGQRGARDAVAALECAGIAAVALRLPDTLPEKGDVDDLHRLVGDAGLADALAGLMPLDAPAPRVDIADEETREWQERLADNLVRIDDLPDHYQSIVRMFQPLARMFDDEDGAVNTWATVMFLPFWSSLFPKARLQNLNLGIWALGLSPAGSGKNAALDAFHALVTQIHRNVSTDPVSHFTAGTPEGMWRDLDGTGKRMLVFQREFGGWLKQMRRDHMLSAREAMCDLYDGAIVGYRTSKGPVTVIQPHVVAAATTTPESFIENVTQGDITNGYISRFMLCMPDYIDQSPENDRASWETEGLATELTMHVRKMGDIERVVYAETGTMRDPQIIREFAQYLGLNTGRRVVIEEHLLNPRMPAGRPLVRVKKISALLAFGETAPETMTSEGQLALVIMPEHIELAIRLVQIEIAYTSRLMQRVDASDDYLLTQQIERVLRKYPSGLSQRDLCRKAHRRASEVEIALRLLLRDGIVAKEIVGRVELWRLDRI